MPCPFLPVFVQSEQQQLQKEQQTILRQQTQPSKKQTNQRLFDSIRDDIDDVSNTLAPAQKPVEENIKPAVDVKTDENINNLKLITPVMNKPSGQVQKTQPAVNYTKTKKQTESTKKELQQDSPANELPHYDWNLKNIYLQKIGHMQ